MLITIIHEEEVSTVSFDFLSAIMPIAIILFYLLIALAIIFTVVYLFKRINRIIKNQEQLIHLLQEDKQKP
ncbi:hypothetical protein GCM10007216_33510 [Thalassobacillus devorans]|uniref:DUF4083 domain-containing protein n=1 Tax=Thalassobacillus devorans TaxID=279813 RepID=A0ABQ1PNE8_9BACI|nr:hypothetical protein [Thalassobacillus devorans]NIK30465.1 flagellar biogenesis protein FliO [Thalassobacillus devorans]GGD00076.1 hypothetical protein GCM10007216_33510 [Thalassobacillus devorans]